MRGKSPTPEDIKAMLESTDTAPICARELGFTSSTVNRYRKMNGYKIKHKLRGCAVQKDFELKRVDKTSPVDKYLYG